MTLRAPHFSGKTPRRVQPPLKVANLLLTTLAVAVAAAPFFTSELTTPQRLNIQQPLQVGSPLALIENAGEKPHAQYDWPNYRPINRQQPENRGSFLPLSVPAGVPFAQSDWANPQRQDRQQPVQTGKPIALVEDVKPHAQYDWPNPWAAKRQQPEQVTRLIIPAPPGDPFVPFIWPNPARITAQQPYIVSISLAILTSPVLADTPRSRILRLPAASRSLAMPHTNRTLIMPSRRGTLD